MESAARLLRERGVRVVDGDAAAGADLVLVNTCTVTATADQKSRQAVRRARRANPDAEVVVTGCSVQVGREAFAAADPDARLVDNRSKDALLEEIERLVGPARSGDARVARALPTLSGVEIEGIADEPRVGRADPGVREGPGRLLVLLHLLHHPGARAARSGASPRRPCCRTSGARSARVIARSS